MAIKNTLTAVDDVAIKVNGYQYPRKRVRIVRDRNDPEYFRIKDIDAHGRNIMEYSHYSEIQISTTGAAAASLAELESFLRTYVYEKNPTTVTSYSSIDDMAFTFFIADAPAAPNEKQSGATIQSDLIAGRDISYVNVDGVDFILSQLTYDKPTGSLRIDGLPTGEFTDGMQVTIHMQQATT